VVKKKVAIACHLNYFKAWMIIPEHRIGSQAYVQACDTADFYGLFFPFEQLPGVF
jgi:hypothetical protein